MIDRLDALELAGAEPSLDLISRQEPGLPLVSNLTKLTPGGMNILNLSGNDVLLIMLNYVVCFGVITAVRSY